MTNDRIELVGFVADASVVRNGDPATTTHLGQPLVVRAVGPEVIPMAFNR
jgi:hypothetical protein